MVDNVSQDGDHEPPRRVIVVEELHGAGRARVTDLRIVSFDPCLTQAMRDEAERVVARDAGVSQHRRYSSVVLVQKRDEHVWRPKMLASSSLRGDHRALQNPVESGVGYRFFARRAVQRRSDHRPKPDSEGLELDGAASQQFADENILA